jgi:hypothetical protein
MMKEILAARGAATMAHDHRPSIAKAERELRRYHEYFVWRSLAARNEAERIIAAWRANPPATRGPAPRLNGGDDYTLDRFPGEVFRDGMRSPGE